MADPPDMRVGHGFDIHRFGDGSRPLVLGGVTFPDEPGLEGHSDADVVAHAITEAILGAARVGDIGTQFPDSDPVHAGADSVELLRTAVAVVAEEGWKPMNIDCSVVLDAPRLAPRRAEMERILSDTVGAPVGVKGRRSEGLGALGRGEGVAAWAVALLIR